MSESKHIFISHAVENATFAGELAELMSQRGATVFMDADVRVGDRWSELVRAQIETASAFVLLIPPDGGTDRNNVWFEAGAARALGKRILAVLPPKGRTTKLPVEMADVIVLDADQRPLESIADTLIQAVPERSESLQSP